MMKWLRVAGSLASAWVAVSACSASKADKYPTYDSMCTDVAAQECQVASGCGASMDACTAARKKVCLDAAAAAIVGGRTYTAGRAEDCVNKTQTTYSKIPVKLADLTALADTCGRVYSGTKGTGDVCASTYECSGNFICDKNHCATQVQKKKGEGCGNPGDVCETGTFCGPMQDSVRLCTVKQALGGACDPKTNPCIESARCVAGVCQPRVGAGFPCDPARETDANADCNADAPYCDKAAGNLCTIGLLSPAGGVADCKAFGGP